MPNIPKKAGTTLSLGNPIGQMAVTHRKSWLPERTHPVLVQYEPKISRRTHLQLSLELTFSDPRLFMFVFTNIWCGRLDSNLHGITPNGFKSRP
jgi:hypothetical protein